MVARAEMSANNEFVLKAIGTLQEVVQMHVAELVNLLASVLRSDKAKLRKQDLVLKGCRTVIKTRWAGVACVGNERRSHFLCHRCSGQAEFSDLIARQPKVFFFELEAAIPHDIANRRNRMR